MSFDWLSPEVRRAGVRMFTRIADQWELTNEQRATLLGLNEIALLEAISRPDAEIAGRMIERISLVVGISVALWSIFPSVGRQQRWLRAPNSAAMFGGRTALDMFLSEQVDDLYALRRYLDAQTF